MILRFFRKNIGLRTKKKTARPAMQVGNSQATAFAHEYLGREAAKATKRLSKDMQKNYHQREDERQHCFTISELTFPETGARLSGMLLDASRHGVTFRPASYYIQNRIGERVRIDCGELRRIGIVRSVRPDGYGIQVLEPFSEEDLELIYAETVDLRSAAV